MRVVVDFDLCESNAVCRGSPEVFEVRDDDFLYVLGENPPRTCARSWRGGGPPLPPSRRSRSREDWSPIRRRRRRPALTHGNGDIVMERIVVVGVLAGFRAAEALGAQGYDGASPSSVGDPPAGYDRPPLSKQIPDGGLGRRPASSCPRPHDPADGGGPSSTGASAPAPSASTSGPRSRSTTAIASVRQAGDRHGLSAPTSAATASPAMRVLRTLDDAVACGLTSAPGRGSRSSGRASSAWRSPPACRAGASTSWSSRARRCPSKRAETEMGALVADLHRDHEVDLRLGVGIDGFADDGAGRVTGVRLADGTTVDAEVVVVVASVIPNTGEWLEGPGSRGERGGATPPPSPPRRGRRRRRGLFAQRPLRGEVMRGALGQRHRDGSRRRRPDSWRRAASPPCLRAGAVVLVRPLRPQDPAAGPLGPGTTRCRSSPGTWPSGASSPSAAAAAASSARLGWNRPATSSSGASASSGHGTTPARSSWRGASPGMTSSPGPCWPDLVIAALDWLARGIGSADGVRLRSR